MCLDLTESLERCFLVDMSYETVDGSPARSVDSLLIAVGRDFDLAL